LQSVRQSGFLRGGFTHMHNAEHAIVGHIESDPPIVMGHARPDGRQPAHALLTTTAFGAE